MPFDPSNTLNFTSPEHGQKGHIMDFASMNNEALASALAEKREKASTLFALTEPTIEQVNEAEALVAAIGEIEAEQATRAAAVKDAADRFAAARATFSAEDGDAPDADSDEEDGDEETDDGDESVEAAVEDEESEDSDDTETEEDGDDGETVEAATEDKTKKEEPDTMTASVNHTTSQTIKASAAKRVGRKVKRPAVPEASPVTITAAADVPGFATGSTLSDMAQVAKAAQARVKGFAPFNARAAQQVASQSDGQPVLHKFGVASFGLDIPEEMTATQGEDYNSVRAAIKAHQERIAASIKGGPEVQTAAGWCAPSEVVYNWIADYVVDGLLTLPEISAPRGGLMITEGPQLAQTTYADLDNFGFGGTEAEAIAGYTKTCETIECPEFTDHRLDFSGYCWKIPILTEKAYPELVADALRLSNVLYAHKMNARFINDIAALSGDVDATNAFGGTLVDTLEAFTQVAVKERRWWNIGENAVMEVKLPVVAREIFKFDMARRSGLALNDVATDQKVAAHFAAHNLSVEYVADWQENIGQSPVATADWPATIRGLMYPAGTFAKAVEDVINLSAVYDAASLSANEYTGVFFEQGVMTLKLGYRSHEIEVPVCTAGATGANAFECPPVGSF